MSKVQSIRDFNVALCKALGFDDVRDIRRVRLTVAANQHPVVEVEYLYHQLDATRFDPVTLGYELRPVAKPRG